MIDSRPCYDGHVLQPSVPWQRMASTLADNTKRRWQPAHADRRVLFSQVLLLPPRPLQPPAALWQLRLLLRRTAAPVRLSMKSATDCNVPASACHTQVHNSLLFQSRSSGNWGRDHCRLWLQSNERCTRSRTFWLLLMFSSRRWSAPTPSPCWLHTNMRLVAASRGLMMHDVLTARRTHVAEHAISGTDSLKRFSYHAPCLDFDVAGLVSGTSPAAASAAAAAATSGSGAGQ